MKIRSALKIFASVALLPCFACLHAAGKSAITASWMPNFGAPENQVSVTNRSGKPIQISPALNREYGTSPAITWTADKSYSPDLVSITFYFVGAAKAPNLGANGQAATPITLPPNAQTDIKFQVDDTLIQLGKDSTGVVVLLSRNGKIFFRESLKKVGDQWKPQ